MCFKTSSAEYSQEPIQWFINGRSTVVSVCAADWYSCSLLRHLILGHGRHSKHCFRVLHLAPLVCSGSAGASVVAHSVALPLIEIAFWALDCSIFPTCGAWGSATAAKRGPLKQSWAGIEHSRDDEPLGLLMQMRNVRVNSFFFFDLRTARVYCVAIFLTCWHPSHITISFLL